VPLSVVLQRLPAVLRDLQTQAPGLDEAAHKAEREAVKKFLHEVDEAASSAQGMTLLPPILPDDKLWRSPADVFGSLIDLNANAKEPVDLIADLERLVAARADHTAFRAALETVHKDVVARATARGEYRKVPIEVSFYRGQYFFYSQWLYVFSFLLIAISWLMAQRRWLHWTTVAAVAIPTLYLIVGIAFRCIIRGRPPVTTLYETLLFSTAVAVVVALAIEVMTRQRIGIAAASILGSLGLFVAYRYEAKEAVDTMPSMVAVLDTNFWLATHVTTVTAGYGAGLLASAIAHIYILGKALGIKRNDTAFYAAIGRMVYGALCFGLVFATIGTVLGGIWANESWGRFWGWDPKENGALLICLWGLIVLHARGGGYIGTLATCVSCVILGMVTAFSWWGVNLLGVGLHSYGFTSGILSMLVIFWAIETVVAALGWVAMKRNGADPIAAAKGDGEL
jgi:ABC-type transport system involved in cytochrome c biogenesis permease subunit